MPIIKLELIVERDSENTLKKHFLNHEDFEVYSTKENEELFTMVAKVKKTKEK